MKSYILIGILGLFLVSCGNSQEVVEDETADLPTEQSNESETTEEVEEIMEDNYRIIGMVHVQDGECPLWIEARGKEGPLKLYPVNLEKKYQQEGMKIKFAHAPSMAQQPEGCDIDQVVILSDVTLMR
jgi:hypothetical protein